MPSPHVRSSAQHLALLAILLVPAPAPAQQGDRKQAEAALKEFDLFSRNTNAHVRKAAVETLAGTDHHLVTLQLLELLKDDAPMVRDAAVSALERQTNVQGIQEMIKRVTANRNKPERLAILRSFQKSRPPLAYTVIQGLLKAQDWELRSAAAEVLGCYPDEDGKCVATLLPALDDKEPLVRIAVMDALGALNTPRAQDGALKAAADSDWRVRASAVKVMRLLRQKSAIEPLVKLLATENGRLLDDAHQALVDITGRDAKADAKDWEEWWGRSKEGFKVLSREEAAAQRRKQDSAGNTYAKRKRGYGETPYHGIKTKSRNMVFVIDVSASMSEYITLDETDAVAMADYRERYGEERVKINIAREELINLVAALPGYARFNIITFNAKPDSWQRALVPADDSNKNSAIKFLARLTVPAIMSQAGGVPGQPRTLTGMTNTFEAINAAFGLMQGQELSKNTYKTDADTMFILSDGMPTTGRIVEPQPLLDYVATVNRRAKMVIHCVAFGSANRPFMETMAQQNGGQYVKIGV